MNRLYALNSLIMKLIVLVILGRVISVNRSIGNILVSNYRIKLKRRWSGLV